MHFHRLSINKLNWPSLIVAVIALGAAFYLSWSFLFFVVYSLFFTFFEQNKKG